MFGKGHALSKVQMREWMQQEIYAKKNIRWNSILMCKKINRKKDQVRVLKEAEIGKKMMKKRWKNALKGEIERKTSERRCKVRAAWPQSGCAQKHPNNYQCIAYWCTQDPNDNQLSVINYWGAKYSDDKVLVGNFPLCIRIAFVERFCSKYIFNYLIVSTWSLRS